MSAQRQTVGFDRKIELGWLEATAGWVGQGISLPEIRSNLEQLLEGQVAGTGAHSARGKTITVLSRIWAVPSAALRPLRDEGLALLGELSGQERLAIHWGMCIASYPFFRDVAATAGRLIGLQETVALSQVRRRTAETWGDRSTVARAVPRIAQSFVLWGVLRQTKERGVFEAGPKVRIAAGSATGPWLVEASLLGADRQTGLLRGLLTHPALFPFETSTSARELAGRPRLEVQSSGVEGDLVVLKPSNTS